MTPHQEAKIGQLMLEAAIRDGQFPREQNVWSEVNDAVCHIIEDLDGGTMTRADVILLCGVGDADLYNRAIERGLSKGLFELWCRDGVYCITVTESADAWLDENGKQGRLI